MLKREEKEQEIVLKQEKFLFKKIKEVEQLRLKKEKGITLIALIITIIILIILAGITIVALSGENGILNQASKAKEETEKAEEKEQEDLKELEQIILANIDPWTGEIASNYGGGTGEEADPYIIENAQQLAYLAQKVNEGETYEGKYFKIVNSINLGGMDWTPIGGSKDNKEQFEDIDWNTDKQFKGVLDGQGNIIANLRINKPNSGEIGLIGALGETGVARNIKISSGNIVGLRWVGAIAGISKGTIENCTNSANVKTVSLENYTGIQQSSSGMCIYPGGIVGEVDAGTITNCINKGEIIAEGQGAGGIIGNLFNGEVNNCENNGNIISIYTENIEYSGVSSGGIVGYVTNGIVESCVNKAEIIAEKNRAGGIVRTNG